MKAEDTFPLSQSLECAVIDKPIIGAAAAAFLAWGTLHCGDRWWISLTTAKVTRLKGLCGPTGGWGCARVCSFYCRLDLF